MITPVKRNLSLYKGVDFSITFRLKSCGAIVSPSGWKVEFNAWDNDTGDLVFSQSTEDSPSDIGFLDDDWISIKEPYTNTDIEYNELSYNIDITDADGNKNRYMTGKILCTNKRP